MVIKDATPLTPLAHERSSIFKCKQHTIYDPRATGKSTIVGSGWCFVLLADRLETVNGCYGCVVFVR